jgi:hypothetical protein
MGINNVQGIYKLVMRRVVPWSTITQYVVMMQTTIISRTE